MPADIKTDSDMLPSYEHVLAEMKFVGPLGGENPDPDIWVGGISLNREHGQWALAELKGHDLEAFYTYCAPRAARRCGDERENDSFAEVMERDLGPQSVAASSSDAMVYGLVNGRNLSPARDLEIFAMTDHSVNTPYEIGGHIDEQNEDSNGGCGGIKEQPRIVSRMSKSLSGEQTDLTRLVRSVMGSDYSLQAAGHIADASAALAEQGEKYWGPGYQSSVIEKIKEVSLAQKPVERLVDKHYAVALLINMVPWTTLNHDMLSRALSKPGRPVQAFGYDAWWPPIHAKYLFPGDEDRQTAFATGIHANNAAALMFLTDGSLETGLRQAA